MAESEKWEFMHDNEENYQDVICWGVENDSICVLRKRSRKKMFFLVARPLRPYPLFAASQRNVLTC